jgi:hypothetical protein
VPFATGADCAWLLNFTVSCGSEVVFAVCGSGLAEVAWGAACAAGRAVLACVELLMELLMEELSAGEDTPLVQRTKKLESLVRVTGPFG